MAAFLGQFLTQVAWGPDGECPSNPVSRVLVQFCPSVLGSWLEPVVTSSCGCGVGRFSLILLGFALSLSCAYPGAVFPAVRPCFYGKRPGLCSVSAPGRGTSVPTAERLGRDESGHSYRPLCKGGSYGLRGIQSCGLLRKTTG